ncbi:unnamed protein product [Prorocentrum cordatum]|uniref:Uncharacterized protein n=1 Tax=Prorocentrum cordatum TaxID=2364126 RepID=A0ABN9S4N7_9DINO|nr:unnamed protein product [Polarella glacialis]
MRGKRGGDHGGGGGEGGGEAGRDSRGRARRPGAAEAPGPPAAAPLRRAGRDGGASRPGAETGGLRVPTRSRSLLWGVARRGGRGPRDPRRLPAPGPSKKQPASGESAQTAGRAPGPCLRLRARGPPAPPTAWRSSPSSQK